MSLILDALRKSEAERRRAQVPDLLAQPQAVAAAIPTTTRRWPWIVLALAGVIALAALARVAWSPTASSNVSVREDQSHEGQPLEDQPHVDRVVAITAAPPVPARETAGTDAARGDVAPTRPLIVAPKADASATQPAPASTPAAAAASTGTTASTAASPAANPRPDTSAVNSANATASAPQRTSAAIGVDARNVASRVAPTSTSSPNASPPPAPAAPAPAAAPAANDLPRLADLDGDARRQLPPLKLSMHMWNDAPAQRFVIIDGNRLGIGGHVGDVEIADIVTDGVVLDWHGRRIKLPLR